MPYNGPMPDTPSRIILTGFSGTGKTAVGRRLARALGWEFVDTDDLVVQRASKPVERIFADEGEEAFRSLEREVIAQVCRGGDVVVSTGGGAMVDDENRALMLDAGLVVCLEARPETIYTRLLGSPADDGAEAMVRPLLTAVEGQDPLKRIELLKNARQWAYALAHWTVPTDSFSVEQCVQEVLRAWRRLGAVARALGDPEVAAVVTTEWLSYPLIVGWDILEAQLGQRLLDSGFQGRAYIICDDGVLHPYGRKTQRSLHKAGIEVHLFTFPAGEASKTMATCTAIHEWLAERRVERRDVIVAVGGGVCGDMAGFVAATYLRGITLVQVPTTLLAMVDASIGGKVAVDLPVAKNLVGAFYHPALVLADVSALTTLPERVLREGWAEALKHGLALDAALVELYESKADALLALEPELTTEVVARNAALKARVVTEDERETSGLRALLNYGHTMGHGIEAAAGYSRYLHGEAVAIGMTGAAVLGQRVGVTPTPLVRRQSELLRRFGLPDRFSSVGVDAVLVAMARDKKSSGGDIAWVFLEEAGRAGLHRGVPKDQVRQVLTELSTP
jgi:shikimate kinase/3-dehydroquinate synthase